MFLLLLVSWGLLSASEPIPEKGGDVAVVTSRTFLPSLERWITYRQSQGYRVHLLIQDPKEVESPSLFSTESPLPSPEEIRNQIQNLNKTHPLRGVLIIGDGAILAGQSPFPSDPRGSALNVIPAPRVQTKVINLFGPEDHIASDSWYVDFDSDGFPDLPIGRIPARTPQQLENAVSKILYYEQVAKPGEWQRQAALIAGMAGFSPLVDNVVNNATRKLLSSAIPDEYDWKLVQANWKSPYCPDPFLFRYTVLDELNKGPLFWVYMGHGLHQELDRLATPGGIYKILEITDTQYVNCEKALPIMLFCACYTGAYDSTEPSLAEEFFLMPKGPIAVLASSRTSMPYGMAVFGIELLEEIFERHETPGELTLGEYILAAKKRMRVIAPPPQEPESEEEEPPETSASEKDSFFETEETEKNLETEETTAEEASSPEDDRSSLRKSLDGLAKTFDPTSRQLGDQLEDHRNLFNLFGDPLLRIRFPQPLNFNVPEIGYISESITVSSAEDETDLFQEDWSAEEGSESSPVVNVTVELIGLPTRPNIKGFDRKTYSDTDAARIEYQRTFEKANNRILASAAAEVKDGKWSVELPMTVERTGSYIVRVLMTSPSGTKIGAKRIKIRIK